MSTLLAIESFLACPTPDEWIEDAQKNIDLMLIDHANCEKKAASTALNLTYRYTDNFNLMHKMSRLVREEMRHFEQVISILERRKIEYRQLSASRYAGGLRRLAMTAEPQRLVDVLVIGAFIEARSCERFSRIASFLDLELEKFYRSLVKSESRHFMDYLSLAEAILDRDYVSERVCYFSQHEKHLIEEPDSEFRFHSGPSKMC